MPPGQSTRVYDTKKQWFCCLESMKKGERNNPARQSTLQIVRRREKYSHLKNKRKHPGGAYLTEVRGMIVENIKSASSFVCASLWEASDRYRH